MELIGRVGFLPLLESGIPGYCAEGMMACYKSAIIYSFSEKDAEDEKKVPKQNNQES